MFTEECSLNLPLLPYPYSEAKGNADLKDKVVPPTYVCYKERKTQFKNFFSHSFEKKTKELRKEWRKDANIEIKGEAQERQEKKSGEERTINKQF